MNPADQYINAFGGCWRPVPPPYLPCRSCGQPVKLDPKYRSRMQSAIHYDCQEYDEWLAGFLGIPKESL